VQAGTARKVSACSQAHLAQHCQVVGGGDVAQHAHREAGAWERVPCHKVLRHAHRRQPPQRPHLVLHIVASYQSCDTLENLLPNAD